MKRSNRKNYLFLLLVGVLCLTGCGKKDLLVEATKKIVKLDNYQMDVNLVIGAKSNGVEVEIPVSVESDVDQKNKVTKTAMTISVFGIKVTTEAYSDLRDENNYVFYTKDTARDIWNKEVKSQKGELSDANEILKSIKDAKKVSTDGDIVKYEATFSKEVLDRMLTGLDSELSEETKYSITKDTKIEIEVNKKSGYVTRIFMDLSEVVKIQEENAEMSKMTLEFLFSKFNEVGNVTIDQKIIDSAVDQKMMDAMDYAEEYIDAIEWELYFDSEDHYTNTDLEYDGPKPEKVDVAVSYGSVTDGVIVIDGYTIQITDGEVQTPTKNKEPMM